MQVLHVYYDFRVAPLTFDFAWFLAIAATEARKNKSVIHLNLFRPWMRKASDIEKGYSDGYQEWRFSNIVVRLAELCPDVVKIDINKSNQVTLYEPRFPPDYHPNSVNVADSKTGIPITHRDLDRANPAVTGSKFYKHTAYAQDWFNYRFGTSPTVVMTYRHTPHNPDRNTPVKLWDTLHSSIQATGYQVVVVPDQDQYLEDGLDKGLGWSLVPEAAMDLDLRFSLYANSHATISWANGTSSGLLPLCKSRFMSFGHWNESNRVASRDFFNRKGPAWNEQPIWFDKNTQIYDWKEVSELTADYVSQKSLEWLARMLTNTT